MTTLLQDVRFALRQMARKPLVTVLATLSLALGIGVNTSIFTVVNAVLLRELPIASPDEVVEVYTASLDGFRYSASSIPDYLDYVEGSEAFSGLAARRTYPVSYDDGEATDLLLGDLVSGNYFDVLGVPAQLGRMFSPAESTIPGAHPVVVLSHDFWQRRFGGSTAVLGQTLKLNGRELEVIGVAPEPFKGSLVAFSLDLWMPLGMTDQLTERPGVEHRGRRNLMLTGRLKPGFTREQAQAEMSTIVARLAAEYPETNKGREATLVPIRDVVINPGFDGPVVGVAGFLMVIVGLVLLIACSNIANLFLARASDRRQELALRLALGSGRLRLIRQLLTESLLVAAMGGLLSVLFAGWATRVLVSFRPPIAVPLSLDLGIDARVLAWTLLLTGLTGILCGLAPALRASRPDLIPALKGGEVYLGRGHRRLGLRNVLVVGQVTVSTLLLIGSGLFVRSLLNAEAIEPGFSLRRGVAVTLMPGLGGAYSKEESALLYDDLLSRARALPGVRSATVAEFLPLGLALSSRGVYADGQELADGEPPPEVDTMSIGPGYFETLGIAVLQGRAVTERDDSSAPEVVVVNETMASRYWPGENPLGQRIRFDDAEDAPFFEVVGLVRDGKYRTLGEAPRPYLYTSFAQTDEFMLTLILDTPEEARTVTLLRRLLNEVDPHLPIFEIKTVSEHLEIMLFAPRMGAGLLASMGLLGLLLASVGLYGVVAYSVARRTREIGVRMALGAGRGDILRMVVREGMALVMLGSILGIGLALVGSRAIASLLFGISTSDPVTYVAVPLLLISVAWLANFLPARRATGVDPIRALRYE